jgi:hypothetical protein
VSTILKPNVPISGTGSNRGKTESRTSKNSYLNGRVLRRKSRACRTRSAQPKAIKNAVSGL